VHSSHVGHDTHCPAVSQSSHHACPSAAAEGESPPKIGQLSISCPVTPHSSHASAAGSSVTVADEDGGRVEVLAEEEADVEKPCSWALATSWRYRSSSSESSSSLKILASTRAAGRRHRPCR
jgi:hypothetical protein